MNLPQLIRTVRWMILDTLRQAVAGKLIWVTLAATAVCTLFCASVEITGDPPKLTYDWEVPAIVTPEQAEEVGEQKIREEGLRVARGRLSFAFGAFETEIRRDRVDAVRHLQVWLAGIVADTVGVLIALLWTAGFLPTFLEPQAATVLMAKPVPRWTILFGKYLGVVGFVGSQVLLFILCTWLGLGLSTGVWTGVYWLAVPLLILNFGIFYAVSAFLAVWTRNSMAAAFGTFLFWALCWTMNYTHHRMYAFPIESLTPTAYFFLDVGYWCFPKPLDFNAVFFDAMRAEGFVSSVQELKIIQEQGRFYPEWSLLSSVGFAAVVLALAGYELETQDY